MLQMSTGAPWTRKCARRFISRIKIDGFGTLATIHENHGPGQHPGNDPGCSKYILERPGQENAPGEQFNVLELMVLVHWPEIWKTMIQRSVNGMTQDGPNGFMSAPDQEIVQESNFKY